MPIIKIKKGTFGGFKLAPKKKTFKKIELLKKYEPKEFTRLIKKIKLSKNQPKWYKKMFEGYLN